MKCCCGDESPGTNPITWFVMAILNQWSIRESSFMRGELQRRRMLIWTAKLHGVRRFQVAQSFLRSQHNKSLRAAGFSRYDG